MNKTVMLLKSCLSVPKSMRNFSTNKSIIDTMINDKTGVVTLTMINKPVNAMTLDFFNEFCGKLDELKKDNISGLIITSGLNNVFAAGLDINELHKPDKTRFMHYYWMFQEFFSKLYSAPFPTVAAINGSAPAGGCMLSLSTEYRVMRNNYKIGLNETQLGLVAPAWLMDVMASIISPRNVEMSLTLGRLFTSEEALKIGLVDEIASDNNEMMEKAEAFINKSNKTNQRARSQTKSVFREKIFEGFKDKREYDREVFVSNVLRPEIQQQIETYLNSLKSKK